MTLGEIFTTAIAIISLVVAGLTAWLTLFRTGWVEMTRPAIIAFAFEGPQPKVFLRFLLYSTAQRGNIVENMYVVLVRDGKRSTYTFWGYGDGSLVRGSGLFVDREGIAVNHHFVRSKDEAVANMEAGKYTINVLASLLGRGDDVLLRSLQLDISDREAVAINNRAGVLFDWNPDSKEYRAELG